MRPGKIASVTSGYEAALARLPDAYATVLRLAGEGLPDDEVATRLGVEPESLPPMLELAYRKLHNELTRGPDSRQN